jgi:hypothetical protein
MLVSEVSDWSSDVCSSDLPKTPKPQENEKKKNILKDKNKRLKCSHSLIKVSKLSVEIILFYPLLAVDLFIDF